MRILLVDDDELLMETLAHQLIQQRYAVDIAIDGSTAEAFVNLFSYDLIVLDMLLPDTDGTSLCKKLRRQGITQPILILTAKDNHTDKVSALDAGADDYVVKPFDFKELCARIRALLRRDSQKGTTILSWEQLRLDPKTFEVSYGDHQLHTTPKEYALLELFLRHPNRVFSLDVIIDNLWSFEDPPSGDAVRTHIKGLRQKLKAGGAPKNFIGTVYGVGYRLMPLATGAKRQPKGKTNAESISTARTMDIPEPSGEVGLSTPSRSSITAAIADAWEKHRDTMYERLTVLDATVAALDVGQLSVDLQQAGCAQAHKLAGALGCFGFNDGSKLARQLERLLQLEGPLEPSQSSQCSTLLKSLHQSLENSSSEQVVSTAIASAPRIAVVGVDTDLQEALIRESVNMGLLNVTFATPSEAHRLLQENALAGMLLHIKEGEIGPESIDSKTSDRTAQQDFTAMDLLDAIAQCNDDISVVVLTPTQAFQQRLHLVQKGVSRILATSASPQHIIEALQQTLTATPSTAKILIVDDDTQILDFLNTLLSQWGFQLTTLNDAEQLWSTLDAVQPHLLVLDVEMPHANGLELCQVLRADDQWRSLPVLFLTVHEDQKTQQQAFNVGADDFIPKSVMATELPNRILNRLQRSQP